MSTLKFDDTCSTTYDELKIRRKYRFILFKIDDENTNVSVEKVGARNDSWSDLIAVLPERDCRYVVFDHEFDTDRGVRANKLWMIVWTPHNSTTHRKMAYSAAKARFQECCLPGCFESQASNIDELEVNLGFKKEEVETGGDDDFDF